MGSFPETYNDRTNHSSRLFLACENAQSEKREYTLRDMAHEHRYLGYVQTIPDSFSCRHEKLSGVLLSTLEIRAGQLRSVREIAPKSSFFYVNRSHIRYVFHAGAKAFRYCAKRALEESIRNM